MIETFISVDIETSGPVPGEYSMLALGACVVGDSARQYYAEMRPISDAIVPAAMQVVGKSLEDFRRMGRDPREVMAEFGRWLGAVAEGDDLVFVGFNAAFDWAFVNWYFHKYEQENPFGVAPLDIKSFYMGIAGCAWQNTRSSRLLEKYRGSEVHTHHALEDAIEQAAMFEKMARDVGVRLRPVRSV